MTKALILVDIQNDFFPGGALAVPKGDEIIPLANQLKKFFEFTSPQLDCIKATLSRCSPQLDCNYLRIKKNFSNFVVLLIVLLGFSKSTTFLEYGELEHYTNLKLFSIETAFSLNIQPFESQLFINFFERRN